MAEKSDPTLKFLNRLVGDWITEATHQAMPGVVVHGTVHVEWLEGEKFLIHRATTDHPDFPQSIAIFGRIGSDRVDEGTGDLDSKAEAKPLRMQYYDSRGVFRDHDASAEENSFSYVRIAPGFRSVLRVPSWTALTPSTGFRSFDAMTSTGLTISRLLIDEQADPEPARVILLRKVFW